MELSLLQKYFKFEENFGLDQTHINAYLKTLSEVHLKKKAPAFTPDDIFQYCNSFPNEPPYLVTKLFVLCSYYAALRTSEAVDLKMSDVNIAPEGLFLSIWRKKTDKAGVGEVKLIP